MVRHGDWKMSTEGVQNTADNGGAHHNPHENGELLRNAEIASGDVVGEAFLHDSVVGARSPSIQDGGAGTDMVRQSSFEDFIGFGGGRLETADCDIADVAGFSPSIVDGSSEWLKSAGSDVDGKMGFSGDGNVVGLELSGEKSVHREIGDLFTSDNPLTADIPFSLSDGLSLPCSISNFAKLSAGLCHSSPVSPTNFLDESMPASRSRSYSDTENDDRSQTSAFLEELERGSVLTAEDKEVMETSRKELQAYEFQVLAQDKSNSLLTPQELETLRVHGLEFEEAVDSSEALPIKSEVAKDGARDLLGTEVCAPSSQSDLLGIVKTSLAFLSDSGKESDSQSKPLAESLLNEASQKVDEKPGEAVSEHSNCATSSLASASELGSSPSGNWLKVNKTRQHSKKQPIKQQATLAKNTKQSAALTKQQTSQSNMEQLASAVVDDKKQLLQLDIADGKLPLCVPNSTVSVPQQWSASAIVDNTTNVAATLPISGGKNVYLTAVPMLYYKDGCLMIPIQQILTAEQPTDSTAISSCETTAAAAAVSVDTAAAAAAKPADSTWEASAGVIASTDNNHLQKSPSAAVPVQQTNNTKPLSNINLTKQPTQANAKVDSKGAKKWVCNVCSQAFPRHYKLKIHFMKHTGEKPYKCSQPGCKWAFTTACKLKRHEESHLGKKDYVCDVEGCGKKFSTVYNLNTHKKSHSRLCTVECPTCNEKFSTQRQLDYHMRAQGHGKKELTYTCPHEGCGRKFFSRYCMGSHVRVHSHLEKIPCPVEGCKRVFDKQCRLQQHIRSHTGEKPFLCTGHGCGAAFATASKLKRHARKHTGERRWVCDVEGCGKAFLRAEHLRAHRITHTGEKPFQCNVTGCAARFKCKSSLYVHLKRHTQNANRDRQDGNAAAKGQRANKQSHKSSQNQKNSYNRQIQNALGDLFTLINANDLESLINSQVDTTQQVPDSVRTGTNTVETLLHAVHTQSVNPSDVLSVTQDGLPTILNINPVATSVQQTVGQLIQQGSSLPGDVLQQGCVLPSGVNLFKDQLRSVINVAPVKIEKQAVGLSASDNYAGGKKVQRTQTAESSPQMLGFSGPVKVEINHTEFPDSTTLSIQEDQVSTTANNLVNPNDVMTSQAITFRDPETGAIYVQTQLLQDDPPNPDVYGDGNIVCLDNNDQAGLADFPNIFNDPGHDDLVDPPGVLEFTGTTINLQDLE